MPRGLWGSRVSCVIEAHSDSLLTVRFFVHFCVDSVVFFHIIHFIMDFFSVNMTGVFISVRRRLRSSSVPIALHLSWMRMWQGERWHIWSTLLSWLLFWCCCRSLAGARYRHGNVHHVQFRDHSDGFVFAFGTLIGGAYEYICSVFTEIVFGKIFWDYRGLPFNLGGRINLLYCFFWGIATVVDKISNQMILKRLTMYFIIPTGAFFPILSVIIWLWNGQVFEKQGVSGLLFGRYFMDVNPILMPFWYLMDHYLSPS